MKAVICIDETARAPVASVSTGIRGYPVLTHGSLMGFFQRDAISAPVVKKY